MTTLATTANDHHEHHDNHPESDSIDVFGFWIYIMTDCVLFATLFAAYAVLGDSNAGGPTLKQLISLPYVFAETMALLASSFTYGMAMLGIYKGSRPRTLFWLFITFLFGLTFVSMEMREFLIMYNNGDTWHLSASLSAFFTLVGAHGLHVSIGLFWMLILMIQLLKFGVTPMMLRRIAYLGLFWHFLDIVWIFVFTIVYLFGAI